jgi:methylglutaconyl-CoA hydratase
MGNATSVNAGAGLDLQVEAGVARLWLDRPGRRNAFDPALIGALIAAVATLGADPQVRIIVLGGRGSAFCAGADLEWMARLAQQSIEDNRDDALQLAQLFATLDACPKPTVARVHGACFGGGIGLVAACDLAVAARGAPFAFSEVRIGLLPATIGPYALRAMGHRAASRYMLTGETFDAAVAAQTGLVSVAVEPGELDPAIDALLASLLRGGPAAQSGVKRLLRDLAGRAIDETVVRDTAARIAAARASAEGRDGLAAVLGKRPPAWAPRDTAPPPAPASAPAPPVGPPHGRRP